MNQRAQYVACRLAFLLNARVQGTKPVQVQVLRSGYVLDRTKLRTVERSLPMSERSTKWCFA